MKTEPTRPKENIELRKYFIKLHQTEPTKLNNRTLLIKKVDFLMKWVYYNPMRQFDPIVKHILDLFGIEFAMLLFDEPGLEVLQRLDTQQATIKVHQNDMTFKVQRANGEVILHHYRSANRG